MVDFNALDTAGFWPSGHRLEKKGLHIEIVLVEIVPSKEKRSEEKKRRN